MTEAFKVVTHPHEEKERRRRRRYEGASGQAAHPLTPLKVALLAWIAECGMLSTPQLLALSGYTKKSAYNHLRDLLDHGLISVVGVPRAALAPAEAGNGSGLLFGSAPNIYVATKAGLRLLYEEGLIDREVLNAKPPAYEPRNSLFLSHELEVRDIRVWLEKVKRNYGAAHKGVLALHYGTSAEIDFGDDTSGSHGAHWVRPDAWFVYGLREPGNLVGLVEVDRGTERGRTRWAEKFVAYTALFSSNRVLEVTGQKQARVLVVTPNATRRDMLGLWLSEWLSHVDLPPDRFWLAEKAALGDVDLRAAVWRVPKRNDLTPLVPEKFL